MRMCVCVRVCVSFIVFVDTHQYVGEELRLLSYGQYKKTSPPPQAPPPPLQELILAVRLCRGMHEKEDNTNTIIDIPCNNSLLPANVSRRRTCLEHIGHHMILAEPTTCTKGNTFEVV